MSDKLPSIDDFAEDNSNLPSAEDIIKEEDSKPKGPNTVNNALFVGSTAELAKMIKESDLSSSSK